MEFLDIVNEKDEVIGNAPVNEIYEKCLPHRIVHIFVFNNKQEMLLQMRNHESKFCPFHWCTAAAGHVKSGETYEQAATRELEEETHIVAGPVYLHKDIYELENGLKKSLASFRANYDGELTPGDKVEKLQFFGMAQIQSMINKGEKFHSELLFLLRKHYGIK